MRCLVRPQDHLATVTGLQCVRRDRGTRCHNRGTGIEKVCVGALEAAANVDRAAARTTGSIDFGGISDHQIATGNVDLPAKSGQILSGYGPACFNPAGNTAFNLDRTGLDLPAGDNTVGHTVPGINNRLRLLQL